MTYLPPPCPSKECAATGCDCMIEDHHSFDAACKTYLPDEEGICTNCAFDEREHDLDTATQLLTNYRKDAV